MTYTPGDGFPYYYHLAGKADCRTLFASDATFAYLDSLTDEQSSRRYSPGKWSIRQVVGHIADHERIKMGRALFLSRNQEVELWGYDQEALMANSRFDELGWQEIVNDFRAVRESSRSFVTLLSEKQLSLTGRAHGLEITLEAFLKSIIGHEKHHIQIIREKYL